MAVIERIDDPEEVLPRKVLTALREFDRPPEAIKRAYASQPDPGKMLETRSTRDARENFVDEYGEGWRCIPVPPDDSGDWFVLDDTSDHRTLWARRVDVHRA
jgi:hypothetical protein